jgi:hypothetical protein
VNRLACGRAFAAHAAVLREVRHETIHGTKIGAINELPTLTPVADEACSPKILQMERQRRGDKAQPLADTARRQSLRASFDQEPEDRQPMLVCQGTQGVDYIFGLHETTIFRLLS